jgi:hypothetical protein
MASESRVKVFVGAANSGLCNNCTPKGCLHILVHFQTNAL